MEVVGFQAVGSSNRGLRVMYQPDLGLNPKAYTQSPWACKPLRATKCAGEQTFKAGPDMIKTGDALHLGTGA